MLMIKTILKETKDRGIGVFAAEAIENLQPVYVHNPRFTIIVEDDEIEAWPEATKRDFLIHAYRGKGSYRLNHGYYYNIDNSKYMNHSDTPNLTWLPEYAAYVAARKIEQDEELTCDYNEFAEPGDACFNW